MNSPVSLSTPATVQLALRHVRAWIRPRRREAYGSIAVALSVLGGFGLISQAAGGIPRTPLAEERPAPATSVAKVAQTYTPFQVRDIAPDKAVALNAAVPLAGGPNPAAQPFRPASAGTAAFARSLECLTEAVYYEAAREPDEGQRAVAQVVLNRVRHPAFANSVCGVVYQGSERPTGCQFSFTCDGSLYRQPMREYWNRASAVARAALQGYVYSPVGMATHYHANYVVPYWSPTLDKSAAIATHIFYRWKGGWGEPAAFTQRYTSREGDPKVLRSLALAAEVRNQQMAPGMTAEVTAAKQELPPELAALVSAEAVGTGKARIKMRIPTGRAAEIAARERSAQSEIKLDSKSDSLRWSMTGDEGAVQQPLGRAPASSPPASAQSTPAKPAGGASE